MFFYRSVSAKSKSIPFSADDYTSNGAADFFSQFIRGILDSFCLDFYSV